MKLPPGKSAGVRLRGRVAKQFFPDHQLRMGGGLSVAPIPQFIDARRSLSQ
jgi:hypothetical protein